MTLATIASDSLSGLAQMRVANSIATNGNGLLSVASQPYAASTPWTLPNGDGVKTIASQYQDRAGNWSAVFSTTIILDRVAPTVAGPATYQDYLAQQQIGADGGIAVHTDESVGSDGTTLSAGCCSYEWTSSAGAVTLTHSGEFQRAPAARRSR